MLAAPLPITPLKSLKPYKFNWRIEVKILYVWRQYSIKVGETIEMWLVDSNGDKIAANVKKDQIQKFEKDIIQGSWIYISIFGLTPTYGAFKISDLKFKLGFMSRTVVKPSANNSDDMFPQLANYDTILAGNQNMSILFDFLGQVVDCGELKDVNTSDKPTKKIDFHMRNKEDTRILCTLWGKFAEALSQAFQECSDGILLCLIRFGKVNLYNDIWSVSNSYDSSQVHINPNLPEVHEFKKLLPNDGLQLTTIDSVEKNLYFGHNKKPKLEEYPILTIQELLSTMEIGICRISCTIIENDTDYSWFYFSCRKCNRKTVNEDSIKLEDVKQKPPSKYWCEVCTDFSKAVAPKFLIHIKVKDETGEARCMLFDSYAQEIVGTPVVDLLIGSTDEFDDPQNMPEEVRALIGKSFQFLLSVEPKHIHGNCDIYKVVQVLGGNNNPSIELPQSDTYVEPYSMVSSDQGSLMITSGLETSEADISNESTPSSKRCSSNVMAIDEQSSTSKKQCSKMSEFDDGVPTDGLDKLKKKLD